MAKNGRPTKYSDKLAGEICEQIAMGIPLRSICKPDNMPNRKTVNLWLANPDYKTFCLQYARAHEDYEDDRFEYLAELREKMLAGEIEPAAFREAFNQIRYELGIRRPKKYGEKLSLDVKGDMTNRAAQADPAMVMDAMRAIVKGGNA